MSNIIPPLLSDSPPPPPDIDDHEDDEYGDFTGTNNLSYDYDDSFSPPGSPLQLPTESFVFDEPPPTEIFDINSNSKEIRLVDEAPLDKSKDFCDKRKDDPKFNETPVGSNLIQDSVSANITEQNVDDKLPISSNTTAPITGENQESELKNIEMIETDCDTKTTSNKTEINILSSRDLKQNIELSNIDLTVEKANDSNMSDDFKSVSVNNDPITINTGANITINVLKDNTPPKQCEKIGNNCSIVDALENIATEAVQIDITEKSNTLNENGLDFTGTSENSFKNDVTETSGLEEPISTHIHVVNSQNELKINGLKEENSLDNAFTGDCTDNQREKVEFGNFDDFGDFTTISPTSNSFQATPEQPQASNIDFDDDDFGDFATTQPETVPKPSNVRHEEPQFEEFASFPPPSENIDAEDDFGDFATTSAQQPLEGPQSRILLLTEKQVLEKSKEIIVEMFPTLEQSAEDFVFKDLEANDKIFNQIKNITDTHALLYQWSKSASQNLLLRALNIDSRNILYGPGWNPSMPRFAANLSFMPLEPVKSEILTPTPAKDTNPPSSSQSSNVEALQFDLRELGLADPLEFSSQSMLLDLEQLVAQLEIPNFKSTSSSHNSSSPANEFESWEAWLQSIPNKESNNSAGTVTKPTKITSEEPALSVKLEPTVLHSTNPHLQVSKVDLEQKPTAAIKQDDFDDFVSYSSPPHRHNIILRETHISNKEPTSKTEENDIVSWLEPTIVTPELSRKERQFVEGDEEFEDFQMVIVPEDQGSKPISTNLSVKPLNVLQPQQIEFIGDGLKENTAIESSKVEAANDDDFGDFTFSLPSDPQQPTISPLTPAPLLEPLKPSVIQSQNTTSAISWPDPGITEDEISRLEALGYARVQKPVETNRKSSTDSSVPPKPTKAAQSKQNSLDDEEWSDFVSVQNASPVHKLKSEKERSSTPDLPLSVLNLGHVQPTKQPIPVITPNGLVQTKLSSNMSLNLPNMMQQTNRVYPQPQVQHNPVYHISDQYASQAYGGFSNYHAQTKSSNMDGDDDEWSDFVSHQSTKPNQLSNWINPTPNIITNPAASFDVFSSGSSVQKQAKKVSGSAPSRRSGGVSSVSMPDLDFLAPRNRTTQRK